MNDGELEQVEKTRRGVVKAMLGLPKTTSTKLIEMMVGTFMDLGKKEIRRVAPKLKLWRGRDFFGEYHNWKERIFWAQEEVVPYGAQGLSRSWIRIYRDMCLIRCGVKKANKELTDMAWKGQWDRWMESRIRNQKL